MPERISAVMQEALAVVPEKWTRPAYRFRFRDEVVRYPMWQRTFAALKRRGLIEWRGGPGTWEWRRKPADV